MHLRLPALLVAVGAIAVASCDDPTANAARAENRETFPVVFTVNGTPATVPTALLVRREAAVLADPNFQFDLGFDLVPTGDSVIVYSVRDLANQLVTVTKRVGLQLTDAAFQQVVRAPTNGFVYDTTFRVPIGKTVLIDVVENECQFESFVGINIRAKMVVDSVDTVNKRVFLHLLTNRNCGLRSLEPGEPRD